jgi:hypothetical protein
MKLKIRYIIIVFLLIILIIWFIINPLGKFGYHRFGLIVYSGLPIPIKDIVVFSNGLFKFREKNHLLSIDELNNILRNKNLNDIDFIIIGTGFSNIMKVDDEILGKYKNKIITKITPDAIKLFNNYKKNKKRVVAIIHSTC